MMHWIAYWIARGGETLGKPTHFEVRDGKISAWRDYFDLAQITTMLSEDA